MMWLISIYIRRLSSEGSQVQIPLYNRHVYIGNLVMHGQVPHSQLPAALKP